MDQDQLNFGDILSIETQQEIKTRLEYISAAVPIGQIVPIYVYDVAGFPAPNPDFWQECNNSIITNKNSPLRNPLTPEDLSLPYDPATVNRTPNYTDKYIRMSSIFGEDGHDGGANVYSFAHNHGGRTNPQAGGHGADKNNSGGGSPQGRSHSHTVPTDMNFNKNVEPPFFGIKLYIRIQ